MFRVGYRVRLKSEPSVGAELGKVTLLDKLVVLVKWDKSGELAHHPKELSLVYNHKLDRDVGETANYMVKIAYYHEVTVSVRWGDEWIVAEPGESLEKVLTRLETSTDRQQEEAGI